MRICKCGATDDKVEFRNNRNMCKPCYSKQQEEYRKNNKEKLTKSRRKYWERTGREVRRKRVKDSNERSPEAFIRTLWHNIRKQSNYKKAKKGMLNKACLQVEVTYEYLLEIYNKQEGCCAITGIPMKHATGDMRTISLDRIDSSRGYVYSNIQFVCQAINRMKNDNFQNDAIAFLEEIGLDWTKEQRLLVYSEFGQFVCSLIGEMRKLIPDQFKFANIPMVIDGVNKGPRKLGWQFVYTKEVVNAVKWGGKRLPTIYFWEDRMEVDTTGIPNAWADDVPGSVLMYNDPEFCAQKACDTIIGRIICNDPLLEQYTSTNPDPKYYHDISLPNYPSKTYTVKANNTITLNIKT